VWLVKFVKEYGYNIVGNSRFHTNFYEIIIRVICSSLNDHHSIKEKMDGGMMKLEHLKVNSF